MSIEIPDQAVKAADLWGGQIPSSNLEEALYEALPFIAGAIYADLRARLGELLPACTSPGRTTRRATSVSATTPRPRACGWRSRRSTTPPPNFPPKTDQRTEGES